MAIEHWLKLKALIKRGVGAAFAEDSQANDSSKAEIQVSCIQWCSMLQFWRKEEFMGSNELT